jgi:hypothetical protein
VEQAGNEENKWHVLNLRYVRAVSVAPLIEEAGMRTFVPPVVSNLLFADAPESWLSEFIFRNAIGEKLSFMHSRETGRPIVVRDADMDLFMRVCAALEAPIVMAERPALKLGDHVRIKEGPLKGVEGDVVRIKKNKRVLINIGNVLWVATGYLKPEQLEVIE